MQSRIDFQRFINDSDKSILDVKRYHDKNRLSIRDINDLSKFLDDHPEITTLNLDPYCRIGDKGAEILAGKTNLRTINAAHNFIGNKGADAFARNTTLLSLNLHANDLDSSGAASLATNTTLTNLDVSSNHIYNLGAEAFASNTTLRTLSLESSNIDHEGAKYLANNTTLTSLNLRHNNVGNEGAKFFADNTTLRSLNLSGCKIGYEGAVVLADNTTLESLDVSFNDLGDAGAIALACNIKLKVLNLEYNYISDFGALALARNTTLRELNLIDNKISDSGELALASNETLLKLDVNFVGKKDFTDIFKIQKRIQKNNERNNLLKPLVQPGLSSLILETGAMQNPESAESPTVSALKPVPEVRDLIYGLVRDLGDSKSKVTSKQFSEKVQSVAVSITTQSMFNQKVTVENNLSEQEKMLSEKIQSQIKVYLNEIQEEKRSKLYVNESKIELLVAKTAILETARQVLINKATSDFLEIQEHQNKKWSDGKVAKALVEEVKNVKNISQNSDVLKPSTRI